ncbi:MAG: HAD-IIIC family phosphatase [Candidatus Tectomicrobia bacterium]
MTVDELLPASALDRLASLIAAVNRAEASALDLTESVSIYFLRNFTVEPIEPFLKYHLLRAGICPAITYGAYGTITQELLAEDAPLRKHAPDFIVFALMLDTLDPSFGNAHWTAEKAIEQLEGMLDLAMAKTRGLIALNTFFPPFYALHGLTAGTALTNTDEEVLKLNRYIRDIAVQHTSRFVLIDWERLLRLGGKAESLDYRFWHLSKAPFKKRFLDLYAREICKAARALKGKAKKCVVLDCDNTLWGGVVGEESIDGIALDRNEWPGSAYYDFQRTLLGLYDRGVLIALCSKNNEADVWDVLDQHPHCLLQRKHLAAWRLNWYNKAANLTALAEELNLGMDAFVFVDDNPAECELIRQVHPEVTVLQVPEALYEYQTFLLKDGYFDTLALSTEDRYRSLMYQQEKVRVRDRERFVDLRAYLQSLQIVARIGPGEVRDFSRIAQLTQKTNQFNLTTRRYSEADIQELAQGSDSAVFSLSVEDRFGAMGLTGVFIARNQAGIGVIDTMLLSCRVLGRDLELALADRCMATLEEKWSIERWEAEYIPTRKNAHVACFWEKLCFEIMHEAESHKRYATSVKPRPKHYEAFISVEKGRRE